MTTLSSRETQTPYKAPVHNGLQHFQDDFWTYDGSTMSCVGRYQDVIDHMKTLRHISPEEQHHPGLNQGF